MAEEGRHEMKRLLNKKGSVLFLVLVVMSLLIIAASATYYVVSNQRSSVEIHYSSEQSYQTALSVSNTVSKYIDGYLEAISKSGNELSSYSNTIVGKMMNMSGGSTEDITSDIDLTTEGMGSAKVTIKKTGTRTDGDNVAHVFEITTMAEVNGETVSVTQVKEILTGPTEYFTRFLTSTGNRPEDVIFSSHSILSEAYFENDYTSLGGKAGLSAFTHLNHSLYSLGTIYDTGIYYAPGYSKEVVVAEHYYVTSTGGGSMYADNIYVGGNLVNGENGDYNKTKAIYADNVYVLGGLEIGSNGVTTLPDGSKKGTVYYVNGDCHVWCGTEFSKIYVNGDLYLHNTSNGHGEFYVKGNVIIADTANGMGWSIAARIEVGKDVINADGSPVDTTSIQYANKHFVFTPSMSNPFDEEKITEVKSYINSSTKKNKYQMWDAEKYFNTTFDPEGTLQPIRLDDKSNPHVQSLNEYVDAYVVTIDQSCIITPAETWGGGGYHNIIIDTSVEEKDIYIYLKPKAGSDTFAFAVNDNPYQEPQNINIYIKGRHSVIFVLPEDVNFKMTGQTFVGHIDVFASLSENNVAASQVLDGSFTNRAFAELKYLQGNGTRLENSLYLDPSDGATKLKPSAFSGSAHNNIFLVTKGTKNCIDFTAQSTFLGYVYAPDAIMIANGAADGLGFIGGLIVGSYTYQSNSALAFTTPYDYYSLYPVSKGSDIVKYLINFANSNGGDGGAGSSAVLQGYGTVGYK